MQDNHTTRSNQRKFSQEQENEICRRYNTPYEDGDFPTAIELGVEFGCSDYIIRSVVRRNGFEVRHNKGRQRSRMFDKATEIAICEYYWAKLPTGYYPSLKEVGSHFGCSNSQVQVLLERHGYETRTNAETRDHRPCKPTKYSRSNPPLCACGCGTTVGWNRTNGEWKKYADGHYKPEQLYHDPVWLRRAYVDEGRSVKDIADQFGVWATSVSKVMKKHGIERRTTSETLILRGSVSGPNNPAWKGGVAQWDYAPDWKRLCKCIKDRDKWTCQLCGEQRKRWGHKLHVHHIDEDKTYNHPHNLISLCSTCHAPLHGDDEIRPRLVAIATANSEAMPDGWVTWDTHPSPP